MKLFYVGILFVVSCIPLPIALNMKGEKIVNTKKFVKSLARQDGVFNDPRSFIIM
jgi:hypothetical protein|tara:strand:+ start:2070 stop:2234 length:165 start_codon:yes stop_codon:yes gene_type:complete